MEQEQQIIAQLKCKHWLLSNLLHVKMFRTEILPKAVYSRKYKSIKYLFFYSFIQAGVFSINRYMYNTVKKLKVL